jgi:hypothetical protein
MDRPWPTKQASIQHLHGMPSLPFLARLACGCRSPPSPATTPLRANPCARRSAGPCRRRRPPLDPTLDPPTTAVRGEPDVQCGHPSNILSSSTSPPAQCLRAYSSPPSKSPISSNLPTSISLTDIPPQNRPISRSFGAEELRCLSKLKHQIRSTVIRSQCAQVSSIHSASHAALFGRPSELASRNSPARRSVLSDYLLSDPSDTG